MCVCVYVCVYDVCVWCDGCAAERAEKIAYNALPATLTPDMWAHQYLQQSNEMNAVTSTVHVWQNDGPNSTL